MHAPTRGTRRHTQPHNGDQCNTPLVPPGGISDAAPVHSSHGGDELYVSRDTSDTERPVGAAKGDALRHSHPVQHSPEQQHSSTPTEAHEAYSREARLNSCGSTEEQQHSREGGRATHGRGLLVLQYRLHVRQLLLRHLDHKVRPSIDTVTAILIVALVTIIVAAAAGAAA